MSHRRGSIYLRFPINTQLPCIKMCLRICLLCMYDTEVVLFIMKRTTLVPYIHNKQILKKISWNSESAEFPEKLNRNVKFLNKPKTMKNYIYIVWHRLMCCDGFDEYILCEFLLFFLCKILLLFIEWRQSSSHDRHFLYFVHKIININIQQLRFSFDKMNKIYKNETETYLHMKSLANPALY